MILRRVSFNLDLLAAPSKWIRLIVVCSQHTLLFGLIWCFHDIYDGVQNRLSKNMTFWHVDYFELKTIFKGQQSKVEIFTSPSLTAWKKLDREPVPGKELLPEIIFLNIRKSYLHGMVKICLPNICSSHCPVNCLPPL